MGISEVASRRQIYGIFCENSAKNGRWLRHHVHYPGVEEIVASPIGAAILGNTATKLVMLQRGDPKALKSALRLNSQESNLIQSLEQRKGVFSEGFMIQGHHRQVIRIEPHPIEYWLSTSDAKDNQWLEELMASKGFDLIQAIYFASEKCPYGVGHGSEAELCAA